MLPRLVSQFGWRFIAVIVIAYGVGQGMIEGVTSFAGAYLYSDPMPDGFDLPATRIAALSSISGLPWIIKPIYGWLSESLPICKYRRAPYIVIASALGTCGFASILMLQPGVSLSPIGAACLLALGSLSIACPDVMVDASISEASRVAPQLAADLQSLIWIGYGACEILSSAFKGPILVRFGARNLLGLLGIASAATAVPAALGWLGEHPVLSSEEFNQGLGIGHRKDVAARRHHLLGLLVVGGAVAQVAVGNIVPSFAAPAATAVVSFVCFMVFFLEHAHAPAFARVAVFLFLDGALAPGTGTVLFKWYKATDDNCLRGRPCFDPAFVGWMDLATQLSFLFGVYIFNRYLSHLSYRTIFIAAHMLLSLSFLANFAWVRRWNIMVHLPDPAFAIADRLLLPLVGRFLKIPKFVLAARSCLPEATATTFAILMMLYNFGGQVSSYFGIGLLQALGGVEPPLFVHLELLVLLEALLKLLPVLAVLLLVPPGVGPRSVSDAFQPAQHPDLV